MGLEEGLFSRINYITLLDLKSTHIHNLIVSYRTLKAVSLTSLVIYFIVGASVFSKEIYPFFSWSLFDRVPNHVRGFTIRIHKLGDSVYNPPLPFHKAQRLITRPGGGSATAYYNTVQDLGNSILKNNYKLIKKNRFKLEQAFRVAPFEYEIILVEYDPVEFWKTGEYTEEKVIAIFQHE